MTTHFKRFPAQEKVVRLLVRHGLSVRDGRIFAGDIEISHSALARAADVDRRIVRAAARAVEESKELAPIFSRLDASLNLRGAAAVLGLGVLDIVPENATRAGILAGVSTVIAQRGISIRQAVVDDPHLADEPHLTIVTEGPVPNELVPLVQRVPGVRSVTVL